MCFKFVYENLDQPSLALPVPSESSMSGYLDSACFLLDYNYVSALNLLRSSDKTQGIYLFLALLFGLFTVVFFLYGYFTGKS